jgi:hypothetical protein
MVKKISVFSFQSRVETNSRVRGLFNSGLLFGVKNSYSRNFFGGEFLVNEYNKQFCSFLKFVT